jgi:guanylate kinase
MGGIARRGLMLVLSSPSGAGKTTIARCLLDLEKANVESSISYTTRQKRNGEKEGRDYHFVDQKAFARMRDEGAFLEWAEVFDHYYGTPREPVERALKEGRDVLFDVDWQGADSLRQAAPDDVVSVFILPPSVKALEKRLHDRAADSDAVVQRRMRGAGKDIEHWVDYDYVVINQDVERSVEAVRGILIAERLRRERLIGLRAFVRDLLASL